MSLNFEAEFVECTDALDGDILRVGFDTVSSDVDEEERLSPYVLISQNFEFPGPATIEWHDGNDYGGGGKVQQIGLKRDRLVIDLGKALAIEISFSLSDAEFLELQSFLQRIVGDPLKGID